MKKKRINCKGRGLAIVLSFSMAFGTVNLPSLTNTAYAATAYGNNTSLSALASSTGLSLYELTNSDNGATLNTGIYYLNGNVTLNADKSQNNALKVAANAITYIYIPTGITLTVYGKDGTNATAGKDATAGQVQQGSPSTYTHSQSNKLTNAYRDLSVKVNGTTGAGGTGATAGNAAIYVPDGAKLVIMGEGTLNANGGKGGNAGNPGLGSVTVMCMYSGRYRSSNAGAWYGTVSTGTTMSQTNITPTGMGEAFSEMFTGAIGAGGGGGGGAAGGGAGIGTNGTDGTSGTSGAANFISDDSDIGIKTSSAVTPASNVSASGDIYIAVENSNIVGGQGGSKGTAKTVTSRNTVTFYSWYDLKTDSAWITHGQPGGIGAAGGNGAGVGNGGKGGSGGSGGQSGSLKTEYNGASGYASGTDKTGTDGTTGSNSTDSGKSFSNDKLPYNNVTFTGAASNATQNYYLTQTDSVTAPAYINLQENQTFTGWKVTTAATALPSAFGEEASGLATADTIYKAGDSISTKGIYGNVTLTPQVATHNHAWKYKVDDNASNKILAYCNADENSEYCSYYGESHAVALTLTAPNGALNTSYAGASVDNHITSVTSAAPGAITYVGVDGTNYAETATVPSEEGTYEAHVTIGGVTATDKFEIIDTNKHSANDVQGKYVGEEPTGSISMTVNCENLTFNYDMETSKWETTKKNFTVTNGCSNTEFINDYETANITVSYASESAFGSVVTGKLYDGDSEIAGNTTSSPASGVTTKTYGLTITNNNPDKKASNTIVRNNITENSSKIGTISVVYGQPAN